VVAASSATAHQKVSFGFLVFFWFFLQKKIVDLTHLLVLTSCGIALRAPHHKIHFGGNETADEW
jgi:hypothetical protein